MAFVSDDFDRSDSGTVGSASGDDTSLTWSEEAGSWGIASNQLEVTGSYSDGQVAVGDDHGDDPVQAVVTVARPPDGGSGFKVGPMVRWQNSGRFYAAVWHEADGHFDLIKEDSGATILGSDDSPGSFTSPRIRIQCVDDGAGNQELKARIWEAGSSEPDTWNIEVTDNSGWASGSFGVLGGTGVSTGLYDDFEADAVVEVPAEPANVSASEGTDPGELDIEWDDVTGETHYNLKYRQTGSGDPFSVVQVPANVTSWTLSLESGTTYDIRVTAENEVGESTYESGVTGTAKASPVYRTKITLSGEQASASHEIWRAPDSGGSPGAWQKIGDMGAGEPEFQDVAPTNTEWYRVRASAPGDSTSSFTAAVQATPSGDIDANTASLTLATHSAVITLDVSVNAATDSLTITTFSVSVGTSTQVNAGTDTFTVTTFLTSISGTIPANTVSLTLTEYRAAVNDYIDAEAIKFFWYSEYGLSPIVGGDPDAGRGSAAWAKDQRGVWREYVQNTPRFTWKTIDNKDIVTLFMEVPRTQRTDRNVDYGTNGTTGWSLSAGTLSVVDDQTKLEKAGLHKLVSDFQVLKVDASGEGSDVILTSPGQFNTPDTFIFSVFARGNGQIMLKASSAADTSFQTVSNAYNRFSQRQTASSSDVLEIKISAGAVVYLVLAQSEREARGAGATSPIRTPSTDNVTRSGDVVNYAKVPAPSPPLAIYNSFVLSASLDDYTGSNIVWILGNATPRMRLFMASGSLNFRTTFVATENTITLDATGLTSPGDFIETLCWYDGDGISHLTAMKNRTTVLGQISANSAPDAPGSSWGTERLYFNGLSIGENILYHQAFKVVTRVNLNQEHINSSDWAALINQLHNANLGPGGNLKGGVSR